MTKSYLISVSYAPGCYRHIRISASATLYLLHKAILRAFDFDDDHAHAFFMNNRVWTPDAAYFSMEMEVGDRLTKKYTLKKLKLKKGDKFKYLFDFGEDWTFQCKVLQELDEPMDFPFVVRSVGDAPEQYPDSDLESFLDDTFPLIFPEEYISHAYESLPVPVEIISSIHKYCEAAANLYGIIPLAELLNIYNSQNPPISQDQFIMVAEVMRHEANDFCILGDEALYQDAPVSSPLERKIINTDILEIDTETYYDLAEKQLGKSFAVLPKNQFLSYVENRHGPITPQQKSMLRFLKARKNRLYGEADEILESFLTMIWLDIPLEETLAGIQAMGFRFKSQSEVLEFANLYQELNNHTRKASNCGHSPADLRKSLNGHTTQSAMQNIHQLSSFGEDD